MEKIKRFIDCYVPISTCTLTCPYCYITQTNRFNNKSLVLRYSVDRVQECLKQERLGGICLINFCAGGETLLNKIILEYIKAVLNNGHFVSIVTNGTISNRFDEISKWPKDMLERLFFKFSYHYEELKKRNLIEVFFSNIKKIRDAGASFTLEVTPYDELMPLAEDLNKLAMKHLGAIPHYTICRDEMQPGSLPILTKMSNDDYFKFWGKFKSTFFDFKSKIYEIPRKEFCYAGDWTFHLNLGTGIMSQCYKSFHHQNIFEDPKKPIKFIPIGCNCCEHHCYNGHVWLALGNIPELKTPSYGEIRNKLCIDGTEWLKPRMKSFLNSKLAESNTQFTTLDKLKINLLMKLKRTSTIIKLIFNRIKSNF